MGDRDGKNDEMVSGRQTISPWRDGMMSLLHSSAFNRTSVLALSTSHVRFGTQGSPSPSAASTYRAR